MSKLWRTLSLLHGILSVNPLYCIMKIGILFFYSAIAENYEIIRYSGPYTFHTKPFVVKDWEINFIFNPYCITTIPLQVVFQGLLMWNWSSEALSKVTSTIGRPLYMDKFTANIYLISSARVYQRLMQLGLHQIPSSYAHLRHLV